MPGGVAGVVVCAVTAFVAGASSSGQAAATGPAAIALAERVEWRQSGQGDVIVLQSGLGDGADVWRAGERGLAGVGQLVSYSRPGYGRSPSTDAARDPCSIARELHGLLQAHEIRPPYLLVGHSLGGLYQWAFAALYPEEVRGLVLLYPTHPQHWSRLQRDAKGTARIMGALRGTFSVTMRAEFDAQSACLDTLDRTSARRVPARLLVRTQYELPELGAFRRTVEALQQDWLMLIRAPQGVERVRGSSHYIQKDRPAEAVRAIREALELAPTVIR